MIAVCKNFNRNESFGESFIEINKGIKNLIKAEKNIDNPSFIVEKIIKASGNQLTDKSKERIEELITLNPEKIKPIIKKVINTFQETLNTFLRNDSSAHFIKKKSRVYIACWNFGIDVQKIVYSMLRDTSRGDIPLRIKTLIENIFSIDNPFIEGDELLQKSSILAECCPMF